MDQRSGCLPAFEVVTIPAGVGGMLFAFAGKTAGVVGFAVLIAMTSLRASRKVRPGSLLRIEGDDLRVYKLGSKVAIWSAPLKDVVDVVLRGEDESGDASSKGETPTWG